MSGTCTWRFIASDRAPPAAADWRAHRTCVFTQSLRVDTATLDEPRPPSRHQSCVARARAQISARSAPTVQARAPRHLGPPSLHWAHFLISAGDAARAARSGNEPQAYRRGASGCAWSSSAPPRRRQVALRNTTLLSCWCLSRASTLRTTVRRTTPPSSRPSRRTEKAYGRTTDERIGCLPRGGPA